MSDFYWYHSNGDGTADRHEDSPAICARVDSGEPGWFSTPEGAIWYGGVNATAFELKTEKVFDTRHWMETGEMRQSDVRERTTINITAASPR